MQDDEIQNNDTEQDIFDYDNIEESLNDDVEFVADEENSDGNSLSGESKLQKSKDKIDKIKQEREEYLLNWQKERADFVNYKRDEESRIARARNLGFERGAMGVIKMLDTFDMAMANQESWNNVDANWRMGIEYIYNEGNKFLSENGITTIEPKDGDKLDHNLHEAVETIKEDNENKDGLISKTIKKGYKTKDYTIRPAQVSVYKI